MDEIYLGDLNDSENGNVIGNGSTAFKYNVAVVKDYQMPHSSDAQTVKEMKYQKAYLLRCLQSKGISIVSIGHSATHHPYSRSDMIGDLALVINGQVLVLRPSDCMRMGEALELRSVLAQNFRMKIQSMRDISAFASAQDVLFTGKEIFVGINKLYTNLKGAQTIAEAYPEYAVQPIEMPSCAMKPLKAYVNICGDGFLIKCDMDPISKEIASQICLKGKFSYSFANVDDLALVNSIYLNNVLIHPSDIDTDKTFDLLKKFENFKNTSLPCWQLIGDKYLLSSLCILIQTPSQLPVFESNLFHEDLTEYLNH